MNACRVFLKSVVVEDEGADDAGWWGDAKNKAGAYPVKMNTGAYSKAGACPAEMRLQEHAACHSRGGCTGIETTFAWASLANFLE